MEVKPGYKQTEVGVIPQEWNTPILGELFTFKNGLNKAKKFFGHGTPIVNYMDVYGKRGLSASDIHGRVNVSKEEMKMFEVRKGDVFFTRTSETAEEVGITSVMLDESPATVFSGFILRAHPKDDSLDNQFKKYCFSTYEVRKQITSKTTETTRALTNGRYLSAVAIARPDKLEQRAIAGALSDVEALIGALDRLIAKKRDLKHAAMQQLLTGQTRLPGFSGEWAIRRFGDITVPRKDRINPRRSAVQEFCVELENIEAASGRLISSTKTSENSSIKSVFREGDVLFGKLRAYLRKYWLAERPGVCSTEIWVLVPDAMLVTNAYLFQLIKSEQFIEAASSTYGTHMPRSDWNVVKNYELPMPPLSEQTAIAAVLSDIDAEIAAIEARLAKMRALKQGTMQELLTGKTRLI